MTDSIKKHQTELREMLAKATPTSPLTPNIASLGAPPGIEIKKKNRNQSAKKKKKFLEVLEESLDFLRNWHANISPSTSYPEKYHVDTEFPESCRGYHG